MWGLAGAFVVEGLELVTAIRRTGGWPWRLRGEVGLGPYVVAVTIRLAVGAMLAAALGTNGQLSGPAGAAMIGITAPLIVEKTFRQVGAANSTLPAPTPPEGVRPATTLARREPSRPLETGDA